MPVEFWMGDSRGRWEGDTLVVDVTHFTTRRGSTGPGISTATRCTSSSATRARCRDHMLYEVTIEDPKVFTRPWKMSMPLYRRQESTIQILEYECYAHAREERTPSEAK